MEKFEVYYSLSVDGTVIDSDVAVVEAPSAKEAELIFKDMVLSSGRCKITIRAVRKV